MKRQSATPPKKRGPPATGKGEPILVRLQPAQLAALCLGIELACQIVDPGSPFSPWEALILIRRDSVAAAQ